MTGLGVLKRATSGLNRLNNGILELTVELLQRLAFGDELRVLVRVGLSHLADADFRGADGRLGGRHVAIRADLRDVSEGAILLLVARNDRDQDLILVDLLAGLFTVLDQYGALRREGIGVLCDGEQLLVLDLIVFLFVEATHLVLQCLDLDASLLHERIGHHQAIVFAVLLDRFTEKASYLTCEVAVRMGEVDIDYQRLSLRIDTALLCEDFLFCKRTREDVATLVGLEDELALRRGEALRDAFDDVSASHRLDGGKEVVIRYDFKIVVSRGRPAVDGRGEAEDTQTAGGAVFRDGVKGVQQGEREEDEGRQQDPPVTLAEHQQVVLDWIALPCPRAVVRTISSIR